MAKNVVRESVKLGNIHDLEGKLKEALEAKKRREVEQARKILEKCGEP